MVGRSVELGPRDAIKRHVRVTCMEEKMRGRPRIGPPVTVRLPLEYMAALTRLRGDRVSQPEMMRQLIEEALVARGEIPTR